MTLDVHVCCEIMAGIYRVSCLHWPHLDVGDVPYGSVCRESQHIAVFRIRFCSQSFVAYRFNIVVINSSSACVCGGGGSHTLPHWKQDVCEVSFPDTSFHNTKIFPSWSPPSAKHTHLLFPDITSLRRIKTTVCISPVCELCCLTGTISVEF